jgi:uncharacterized protein YggE
MNRLGKVLLVAGVLLTAAAIAGVAQPRLGRSATASNPTAITVTGNGTANATPDSASFNFGVTSQASTAGGALSRSGAQARAIVAALEKAGIDAKDIQTTDVSLWPQTRANGTQIVGYSASNSVNVTAPLRKAGAVVDAAVGAGANNVSGPNLDTSDKSSLYNDALKQALADAKGKAQAIATESGLSITGVQKVTEGAQASPLPYLATAKAAAAEVTIEPGTQQILASVTVTYAAS